MSDTIGTDICEEMDLDAALEAPPGPRPIIYTQLYEKIFRVPKNPRKNRNFLKQQISDMNPS